MKRILRWTQDDKADPRHAAIREEIGRLYAQANAGLAAPWTGRHGRALKRLLDANKSWPIDVWLACLRNRFRSEVNLAEDPIRWLARLPNYARGPLDRFDKPKRIDPNRAVEAYWEQKMREAR
jgi:hypothetical protein